MLNFDSVHQPWSLTHTMLKKGSWHQPLAKFTKQPGLLEAARGSLAGCTQAPASGSAADGCHSVHVAGRLTDCTWAPASPAHRLQVTAIRTLLRQAAWQTSLGVLPCFNHSLQLITSISISCQRQPGLQPWQAQG